MIHYHHVVRFVDENNLCVRAVKAIKRDDKQDAQNFAIESLF